MDNLATFFRDLPVLDTPRLRLRRLTLDDAADMFAYASDPEVTRFTSWTAHGSIEDSRGFLSMVAERYREGQPAGWGVVHKGDGRLIGTCGSVACDAINARGELGYALSRRYWGQGYGTQATRAAIAFGFREMGLHRIEAICMPANVASARVMEKAGMTCEGIMRESMRWRGTFINLKLHSIYRHEFAGQNGLKAHDGNA